MKDSEKKLIMDLFNKLLEIENKDVYKDPEAENLINVFLKKQPNSLYYMVQNILIKDVIIQDLNNRIQKLKLQIKNMNSNNSDFLSSEIKNKILNNNKNVYTRNSNIVRNKDNSLLSCNEYDINKNGTNSNNKGISSFIGNALQTALGVAGGMVAGNVLTDFLRSNQSDHNNLHSSNLSNSDNSENSSDHVINNNFIQEDTSNDYLEDIEEQYSEFEDDNVDNFNDLNILNDGS